jgi:hypothetical protein
MEEKDLVILNLQKDLIESRMIILQMQLSKIMEQLAQIKTSQHEELPA